jgi:3-ketosteroid 9alpha-monooxygenase subunit B
MAVPAPIRSPVEAVRDHHFHGLRIRRVVRETADASSFVLEVPDDLASSFTYEAGQFCTFRAWIDGEAHLRCYSMSSTPGIDDELQVTVKRVPDGVVSNWMNDALAEGDEIEATYPAGVFRLTPGDGDLIAFAGGSGITPVFSLVKAALATTRRRVHLLYANRDRDSVIFDAELTKLAAEHPDRLEVVHHLDVDDGFVTADTVAPFAWVGADPDFYLCGPGPFMDIVEATLLDQGMAPDRIHVERFTVPEPTAPAESAEPTGQPIEVTVQLNGRTETGKHHPGTTILQTARQLGLPAPSSCESGSCATCMARIEEGAVTMRVNNALTDDEVEEGWVLTCQSVPVTPVVRVVYEG